MNALERIEVTPVGASKCLLLRDATFPLCRFAVVFPGGALRDPVGAAGAHRAMAELTLRGTATLNRRQFHDRLERLGSSLYVSTSGDSIVFRGTSLSRNLSETLALLADALLEPTFSALELEALVEEMRDGFENERDDDATVADIWFRRTLLAGTPYSRRSQGELPELAGITRPILERVHRERVLDNACVFIGAGDFEPSVVERFVEGVGVGTLFPVPTLDLPSPPSSHVVLVHQPDRDQVEMRLGCLTMNGHHTDLVPFWLGTNAFAGAFSSPFPQEIREKRGWSYTAAVDFSRFATQRSTWSLHSAPALDDALDCFALELELFDRLAQGQLADDAIDFARRYLLNRHALGTASVQDLLSPLIYLMLLGRHPTDFAAIPDRLAVCSNDEVRAALRTTLEHDHLVAVMVGDVAKLRGPVATRVPQLALQVVEAAET